VRSATGDIKPFRGGIGMIAARLDVTVVPVRLDGVDRLLPVGGTFVRPGRVRVAFGPALRLQGEDFAELAATVEQAVRSL
jgi:long-chain acyl-CoA synthetase